MKNAVVNLVTKTATGAEVSETLTEVFAELKPVRRSEFYAGYQAGITAKKMIVCDSLDWQSATINGQEPTEVKIADKYYVIIRAYDDGKNIELTLT